VKVKCPNAACGKLLQVPDDCLGREAQCPACKHVFRLPAAMQAGTRRVKCGRCGAEYEAPAEAAGPFRCSNCNTAAHAGKAPVGSHPRPPATVRPAHAAPTECPLCGRKVKGKKCMYCGADLSLPADVAAAASIDLTKGISATLFNEAGEEVLSGKLRAGDAGLHASGYAPDAKASGPTGGELAVIPVFWPTQRKT
jgi:hypothetical protein